VRFVNGPLLGPESKGELIEINTKTLSPGWHTLVVQGKAVSKVDKLTQTCEWAQLWGLCWAGRQASTPAGRQRQAGAWASH